MTTILLVDDSSTFLESLYYALKSKNVNIIAASCIEETLDKI